MSNASKDLLLIVGVITSLVLLFVLLFFVRHNTYAAIGLALIILPNILAFVDNVPFVPASMDVAKRMVDAAGLKPGNIVYDIGCGDGRIVYLAVKDYGVKGIGIELSPLVYLLARFRQLLWHSGARLRFGNFNRQDFSDADVVFCYSSDDVMARLETKLQAELKTGARVVSYIYRFKNWKEKRAVKSVEGGGDSCIRIYEK